jgi:hypothetical protein
MADYELSLNIPQITNAVKRAFKDTTLIFAAENIKAISEVGAFSSHPDSDIVDTGRLRASQQIHQIADTQAELSWDVDYALYVHEGYVMKNGRVIVGRPWTTKTAERMNIQQTFDRLIEDNLP